MRLKETSYVWVGGVRSGGGCEATHRGMWADFFEQLKTACSVLSKLGQQG
jgi:hypothetical protein